MNFCYVQEDCIEQLKNESFALWNYYNVINKEVHSLGNKGSEIMKEANNGHFIAFNEKQKKLYDLNNIFFRFLLDIRDSIVYARSNTLKEELDLYNAGRKKEAFKLMDDSKSVYFYTLIEPEKIKEEFKKIKSIIENLKIEGLKEDLKELYEKNLEEYKLKNPNKKFTYNQSVEDLLFYCRNSIYSSHRNVLYEGKSEKYMYDSIIKQCNFLIKI